MVDDPRLFSKTYDRMASLRPGQTRSLDERGTALVLLAITVSDARVAQRRHWQRQTLGYVYGGRM